MRSTLLYLSPLLLLSPISADATDATDRTFDCSLVRGSARLQIDGSLSDWESPITTARPLRWSRMSANGQSPDTSSASVRCLADERLLYVGVDVDARQVRFETAPFNEAWRNDSVELFFSSQATSTAPHARTGLIRVSADSNGQTITEGTASVTEGTHVTRRFSYPLLWDALGVKTGLQRRSTGYSVEIAIPRASLGWTDSAMSSALSINVRVRRSCGDKPCQAVIQSSEDPYNSSPVSDELYRPVSFGRRLGADRADYSNRPKVETLAAVVYGALLQLDVLDADGAVELLRESQDRRLIPMMASALMAAGHPDSALSVVSSMSPGESGDGVRLWVIEQMAYSHLLHGASSLAEGEYAKLAASGRLAFQDIGVAGLIELALADGRGDAAMAAYQTAFGVVPRTRSASQIANWLQKRGRVPEAIDVLTRLSECGWAHDSERAWALLQLQSLYQ